jgi:hypothetical protein
MPAITGNQTPPPLTPCAQQQMSWKTIWSKWRVRLKRQNEEPAARLNLSPWVNRQVFLSETRFGAGYACPKALPRFFMAGLRPSRDASLEALDCLKPARIHSESWPLVQAGQGGRSPRAAVALTRLNQLLTIEVGFCVSSMITKSLPKLLSGHRNDSPILGSASPKASHL